MLSTNLGNSGKIMLYLFLTIGLVLGVTAFILVLTKKCEQCKTEDYNPFSSLENSIKKRACTVGSKSFCSVCLNSPRTTIAYGANTEQIDDCITISQKYKQGMKCDKTGCKTAIHNGAMGQCIHKVYNAIC